MKILTHFCRKQVDIMLNMVHTVKYGILEYHLNQIANYFKLCMKHGINLFFSASVISFLMPLFISIFETQGLRLRGWGTPSFSVQNVVVSYLMSGIAVYLGMRQKVFLKRADRCLPRPAHLRFAFFCVQGN